MSAFDSLNERGDGRSILGWVPLIVLAVCRAVHLKERHMAAASLPISRMRLYRRRRHEPVSSRIDVELVRRREERQLRHQAERRRRRAQEGHGELGSESVRHVYGKGA